ncbi:MAG TPA: aspartate--tRNA(Asn) ligase [Candidatus Limnocylindrales bacterium]|nr:aspartate--tRNA(Asn) ligase [Candidatus Limnocylindrales bacterium]
MLKRTLTKDTPNEAGNEVLIKGFVQSRRDHGKLLFIDLRDRSGLIQVIFNPRVSEKAYEVATALRPEFAVSIKGKIKLRPEKLINPKLASGTVELEATDIEILAEADTLPFDMGGEELNLELPTLLDHRSLTLRHDKVKKIFVVQAALIEEFRKAAKKLDCIEVIVPTIAAGATEGGADVFKVDYYGHEAFMIQSPQLYKQIMVSVFERVFVITKAYRAEPSVTTRHLSEVVMMDVEMAFIESFEELLDAVEFVGTSMIKGISEKQSDILENFGVELPLVPHKIPRLKMREAQKIVTKRTGRDLSKELDLNPEDEREICQWAVETHKSDFVTITHYPTKKRAFYTFPDPAEPEYSLSYDLLFKGAEILSGARRINNYDQLVKAMKAKDVSPENFGMYMQAFKYAMPPEGGFSFGLERITMKLLELGNVREASLFPRDMERVDERFSITEEKEKIIQKK